MNLQRAGYRGLLFLCAMGERRRFQQHLKANGNLTRAQARRVIDGILRARPTDGWERFLAFCSEHEILASLGFISNISNIEECPTEALRQTLDQGPFELWNHGHFHKRDPNTGISEFRGRSVDDQVESISWCQYVCERLFGERPSTFGPGFNTFDKSTLVALKRFDEIQVLYDIPYLPGKIGIPMAYDVQCESQSFARVFDLDMAMKRSEYFVSARIPFVLQIHPGGGWSKECIRRFETFTFYLRENGYEFVTSGRLLGRRTLP